MQDYAQTVLGEDVEGLRRLLRAGAQLAWLVPWRGFKMPAMYIAVLKRNEPMVQMLLEEGDSLQRVHNFLTPLSYIVLLQQPEAFAFLLPKVKGHFAFDLLKTFKDILQNNERAMYEELRRYFPVPPLEYLALNDRPPLFYFKDLQWSQFSLFLFVYKRKTPISHLPEPLLRDICTY